MTEGDPNVRLRRADRDDAGKLYQWANDPTVRQRSISDEPITWDEHVDWLDQVLSDPDRRLYVLEVDGEPVGQIRFDRRGDNAVVNVSIDASHRGEGLGRQIIHRGMMEAGKELDVRSFVALIKPENQRSRRAFESAGYRPTGREERERTVLLRFEHVNGSRSSVHR